MSDKDPNPSESKEVSKTTLGDFVDTNQKLLSVLGIFTALTVFSGNLPLKSLGYALAFVFLAISLLLWFEVLRRIPESREWPLAVFHHLMSWAILLITLYWLLDFRSIWKEALWIVLAVPIAAIIVGSFYLGLRQLPRCRAAFQDFSRHKILGPVLDWGLYIIILYLSMFLALIISPRLNRKLDSLHKIAESPWSSPDSKGTNVLPKTR